MDADVPGASLEALTLLATLVHHVPGVMVGHAVLSNTFRHPVLARQGGDRPRPRDGRPLRPRPRRGLVRGRARAVRARPAADRAADRPARVGGGHAPGAVLGGGRRAAGRDPRRSVLPARPAPSTLRRRERPAVRRSTSAASGRAGIRARRPDRGRLAPARQRTPATSRTSPRSATSSSRPSRPRAAIRRLRLRRPGRRPASTAATRREAVEALPRAWSMPVRRTSSSGCRPALGPARPRRGRDRVPRPAPGRDRSRVREPRSAGRCRTARPAMMRS